MDGDDGIGERLSRSEIYKALESKSRGSGEELHSGVMSLVNEAASYCHSRLKTVVRHMPEFTLHDDVHIFNVVHLMEKLIPETTLSQLSAPELMLLLLTAFFHDIGMAPDEVQVRAWKGILDDGENEYGTAEHERFDRFCQSFPDKVSEMDELKASGEVQKSQLLEDFLVSEYIRETHAERTRQIIARDWVGRIKYGQTDLTAELADLCLSHNRDAIRLLDMPPAVVCDDGVYACLPFVGVIIRLADLLDFDPKRTPAVLFSTLSVRNPVSVLEWKKHRAINAWKITPTSVVYSARCTHPAIEAAIRRFCDLIDEELRNCSHVLAHLSDVLIGSRMDVYRIPLPASVDRSKIGPDRDIRTGKPLYIYRDTKFTLSKNQVIDLLMGTKLYANTEVALRELIQNSIDACVVRSEMERSWGSSDYIPRIIVRYLTRDGADYLEVEDNGIGMNQHIIDSYYSRVGSSFYRSREFYDLLGQIGSNYEPISRFGIGILSCFMVSDCLDVQTRRIGSDQELDASINIVVEGYDSIFYVREGERKRPGTLTSLRLRRKNPWERMSHDEFIDSVQRSVPYPPFEIEIETDKESVTYDQTYFSNLDPEDLKKNDWEADDNVRELSVDLMDSDTGLSGRAVVGILQKSKMPVAQVEVLSKRAEIEGKTYELSLSLNYDANAIEKRTSSIDVSDDGTIRVSTHFSVVARSRSSFSIHGIDFPEGLFSDYLSRRRQAELRWPFPMLIVLNATSPSDLDLNTSRTEIINNEKWQKFEAALAYRVCRGVLEQLEPECAKQLAAIYESGGSDEFREALDRAREQLGI